MTFGDRLISFRKARKITQIELGEAIGMKQASIHDYEKNKVSPSIETIQKIANHYNVNLNWLLTGKGPMYLPDDVPAVDKLEELKREIGHQFNSVLVTQLSNYTNTEKNDYWYLPITGDIACGEPMKMVIDDSEKLIPISKKKLQSPQDCDILRVNGESMMPDIEHSDLVVIRRETNWINCNNKIVAVRNSDGLTLKKLAFDERRGTATLIPSNKRYPVIIADESSVLCGYLILLIRYF